MNATYRKLLALAIPATLSVAIDPLATTIDTVLIGQKNASWLASFSSGNAILSSVVFSLNFLVYTVSARVAQAFGQQDKQLLHRETATALAVALLLGLIAAPILALLTEPLLTQVMGLSGEVRADAEDYYLLRLAGLPLTLLASAMVGAARGYQRLMASVAIIAASTIVNGLVTYLCLFVWQTGLWGAALGTTLSFAASITVGWFVLKSCDPLLGLKDLVPLRWQNGKLSLIMVGWQDFSKDAKYQLIRSLILNATFFTATVACAREDTLALAGHQLIYQIMLVVGCFLDGTAVSASTLGGEAIGKKHYKEWWQISTKSIHLVIAIAFILFGILYSFMPETLALFSDDKALQRSTLPAFTLYVVFIPILGIAYQLDGILFGAKMFREAMLGVAIAVAAGFIPPLLYWKTAGEGGAGGSLGALWWVWLSISSFAIVRMLATGYYFWQSSKADYQIVKAYRLEA